MTIARIPTYIPTFNKIKRIPNPKTPCHLTIDITKIINCLFERKKRGEKERRRENQNFKE